jgi:hypothetical protein
MIVRTAMPGTKAFDCLSHITPTQAATLRADGFESAGLYAHLVNTRDLDACFGAGISVFFIVQGLSASTTPSAALGRSQATSSLALIRSLGVPDGVTMCSDLEGGGKLPGDWIEYANAIADAALAASMIPGVYVGAGVGLMSRELYELHATRYWRSASRIVDRYGALAEPSCGWCAWQVPPLDHPHRSGLGIDLDFLAEDYQGRGFSVVSG